MKGLALVESEAQGSKDGGARAVGASMEGMHGAVYVVEDIVHTYFHPACGLPAFSPDVVGSVESPKLEGLAVAIVLIHALAAASCAEVEPHLICWAEAAMPHGRCAPLVVSHAVEGDGLHPVFVGIVEMCLGVEIAI